LQEEGIEEGTEEAIENFSKGENAEIFEKQSWHALFLSHKELFGKTLFGFFPRSFLFSDESAFR